MTGVQNCKPRNDDMIRTTSSRICIDLPEICLCDRADAGGFGDKNQNVMSFLLEGGENG